MIRWNWQLKELLKQVEPFDSDPKKSVYRSNNGEQRDKDTIVKLKMQIVQTQTSVVLGEKLSYARSRNITPENFNGY